MNRIEQTTSQAYNNEGCHDYPLLIMRLACSALFAARAWLYCMNIGPLSTFFWHQKWLEGPMERWFALPWVDYASYSEPFILHVQHLMGFLFAVCAVACWWVKPGRVWVNGLVGAGAAMLIPYWLLRWIDQDFQLPMMLEHFLQWGTPVLLILYKRMSPQQWWRLGAVFCGATFIGHGLYALGWTVPRANGFINLTTAILHLSEANAVRFLTVVGILDIVVVAMLLVRRLRTLALAYMAFWGLATAMARIIAHYTPAEKYYGLHPWLAETVVRFPHGLVSLAILLLGAYMLQQQRISLQANFS